MKAVLENSLTKEQANRLFAVIDLNKDGILQAKELHQVMNDDIKGMTSLKTFRDRHPPGNEIQNAAKVLRFGFYSLVMKALRTKWGLWIVIWSRESGRSVQK